MRSGYKQTEVGVIPEDWNVVRLGSHSDITKLAGFEYTKYFNSYKDSGTIIVVRGTNITHNRLDLSDIKTIPRSTSNTLVRSKLQKGDLAFAYVGTIGPVWLVDKNEQYHLGPNTAKISCKNDLSPKFLFQYFQSRELRKEIDERISIGAQPSLSMSKIRLFRLIHPPLCEQQAIAEALNDADALIEGLESLIAKKRQLKQGAMQKLLQPEEEWQTYSMPEVSWFQEGPGVRNHQFTSSGVKLFNGTNIENGRIDLDKTKRYISESEAYGLYSHFMADAGDIVIACSGISVDRFEEKVAVLELGHLPLCMNTSTMRFKVFSEKVSKAFFQHFLKTSLFKDQISGKATGSAQLNFGPSHVKEVKIKVPQMIEQITIATILSDMDTEISTLEVKLNKARKVKEGMMQDLLTGRVRLV